jgi:hypothetical protein
MIGGIIMNIPTKEEFCKGIEEFKKYEKRDAMYKVATFLVSNFWGKPPDMSDGLGVLLLTWNHAFYRFGSFNFDKLEKCIADNIQELNGFRNRNILSLSIDDEKNIKDLFIKFLDALQIDSGKKQGIKSPVAVAKALHLLAPNFFPLWDAAIAQHYKCHNNNSPAENYIAFCKITKTIADEVKNYSNNQNKTLCKLIDEYNYSKYTQGWI